MAYTANHRHDIKALNRKLFELSTSRPGDAPVTGLVAFVNRVNPKLHIKMVAPVVETSVRFNANNTVSFTPAQQAEYDRLILLGDSVTIADTMNVWRIAGQLKINSGEITSYGWEGRIESSLPGHDKMPTGRVHEKLAKISKAHAEDLQVLMDELATEQAVRGWCEVYEDSITLLNQVCDAQLPKPNAKHIVSIGMSFKFSVDAQDDLTYRNREEKQNQIRADISRELSQANNLDEAIAILQKHNATEDPNDRGTYVQTAGLLRTPVLG